MKVPIEDVVQSLSLEILTDAGQSEIEFVTANIHRPGLFLAGYGDYFGHERMQILGWAEMSFLTDKFTPEERREKLDSLFGHLIPCLVIARGMEPPPELLPSAQKFRRPVFRTNLETTLFMQQASNYIEKLLAPQIVLHGVMVDISGLGVLLQGESGIGKSEIALELVERGHRLVADDAVEITRTKDNQLFATCPERIRHMMEIRGVGIIDVRRLFGIGSVLVSKTIDMVVKLEDWDPDKMYDRIGLVEETCEILGVRLPILTIPVQPGRHLGIVLEVAAHNQQLKSLGYNAAQEMVRRFHMPLKTNPGEEASS